MYRATVYDILYALVARDGREQSLFGSYAPQAHSAFERSIAGSEFPELWFELPLMGDPWFDLHVLTSYEAMQGEHELPTCVYPELFTWFASATGVRQLALSWDIGSGNNELPAAQLLINRQNPSVTYDFLEAANRSDAKEAYRSFVGRIPGEWYACYSGVFPQRPTSMLRIECIPSRELQRAYASDGKLLEQHLRQTGFSAFDNTIIERCVVLAQSPFALEFQFDIDINGTPLDTIGASVRFAMPPGTAEWQVFDAGGAAGELMKRIESWGLADDRWKLLAQTMFAKRMSYQDKSQVLYVCPTFIKLRWRAGAPLDAKAYLIAGVG